jgi:hypothetical protein
MKTRTWLALTMMSLVGALWTGAAEATPGYARQTGQACVSCHFQHYPALNAFGRAFKSSAYTMIGGQSMIQGDDLSIPVALNAALVTKIRYQSTNGSDKTKATNTGELQFPDEAILLLGGRAHTNIGFASEISLTAKDAENNFDSFKVHFNNPTEGGNNLGAVIFSTAGQGSGYGFELLNTGALRMQRIAEDRKATSAQQFIGLGSGAAQGVSLVASNNKGFVNATFWTPDNGSVAVDGLAHYLRAALTPQLGGWDTGFGVQYFGGKAKRTDTTTGLAADKETKGWAVDAQAQGMIGTKPTGFYFTYGQAAKLSSSDGGTTTSVFNTEVNEKKAWSVLGEVGVVPSRVTLLLGYLNGDNGKTTKNKDNALLIGGTWMVVQNIEVQLSHTSYSGNKYDPKPGGGDNLTTLMLFMGF